MTSEEVPRLHTDGFSRALQQHDFAALEAIYSDRYMLVRPDGSVFNNEQVLKDLTEHKVAFHPIELKRVAVRLLGSAAILTAETTILSSRDGKDIYRHIRLIAVYAQEAEAIRVVHFQTTEISVEFDRGSVVRKETHSDTPRIFRFLIGNPLIVKQMAKHIPMLAHTHLSQSWCLGGQTLRWCAFVL